jgi:site-specific DNA recombinase
LFDDVGHRMVPTHATKAGVRYRYYVSLPHLHGESKTASVGSVSRVPAIDVENIIVKSLNEHLIAQKEKPPPRRSGNGVVATYCASAKRPSVGG